MNEDKGLPHRNAVHSKDMAGLAYPLPPFRQEELRAFEDYWFSMRRGEDVPLRTEIDPRGIESLLSNAFIAEKVAPGLARMRIAGLHLCDVMGMEVRGMPVSALITPQDRDRLADAIVHLFERPARLHLSLVAHAEPGAPAVRGTLIILPLRSDLGDVSRALGCLVTEGDLGVTPRRFAIADCKVIPVVEDKEGAPFVDVDTQTPLVPPLRSERPYLKLVRS